MRPCSAMGLGPLRCRCASGPGREVENTRSKERLITRSKAVAIDDRAVGDGEEDGAAQGLACQRRVAAPGAEALGIDHPGLVRIDHHDICRCTWGKRAERQAPRL